MSTQNEHTQAPAAGTDRAQTESPAALARGEDTNLPAAERVGGDHENQSLAPLADQNSPVGGRETINDGGPAFPGAFPNGDNRGMMLRDHFAGKALANLASRQDPAEAIAARAYKLADAMLAERSKGGLQ